MKYKVGDRVLHTPSKTKGKLIEYIGYCVDSAMNERFDCWYIEFDERLIAQDNGAFSKFMHCEGRYLKPIITCK